MRRDRFIVILVGLGLALMVLTAAGIVVASAYRAPDVGKPLIWLLVGSIFAVKVGVHFLRTFGESEKHHG